MDGMDRWMDGIVWMDRMDGWIEGINGWMVWMDGWVVWMDGWYGWMGGMDKIRLDELLS